MFKTVLGGAAAAVALMAVAPASAATVVLTPGPNGTLSGGFEATGLGLGSFSETFTFNLPTAGTTGVSLISIAVDAATNVNFSSATLNGIALALSPNGMIETGGLSLATTAGLQTLIVNGTSGGNGSFGGNVSFAPAGGAIPEPATWALMILGFGLVGGMMRRRASTPSNVKVGFAA